MSNACAIRHKKKVQVRMDNAAAFIDGFNLYHGMDEGGFRAWLWVDLWRLSELLTPKGAHLATVSYYTADSKDAESRAHQGLFLGAHKELRSDMKVTKGYMHAADKAFMIGQKRIRQAQLPDRITRPSGYVIERPATWGERPEPTA